MKVIKTFFLLLLTINCIGQTDEVGMEIISDNNLFEPSIIQVYPDSFPNISVVFQSKNKEGKPLWLVNKDDIGITENGEDCEILRLQNISEKKPLNIGIVFDHSGSMRNTNGLIHYSNHRNKSTQSGLGPIGFAKSGVKEFLNTETSDKDSILFVGFSTKVDKVIELTTDYKKIKSKVGDITATGGTSFFDALYFGINKLKDSKRSVIVALTDGQDGMSKKTYQEVIQYANEKGIAIYIIGLGNVNPEVLKELSQKTSGYYYHTNSPEALVNIYLTIKEQIKSIYQLDYTSRNYDVTQIDRELKFYFKNDTLAFVENAAFFELPEEVQTYLAEQDNLRLKNPANKGRMMGGILFSLIIGIGSFTLYKKRNKKPTLAINKIYPNPFDNFITLNLNIENKELKTELSIISLDGRIVKKKVLDPALNIFTINTSNLVSGLYYVQLANKNGVSKIENIVKK